MIVVPVAFTTWGLERESVSILMESVPHGLDLEALGQALRAVDGVAGVHDLHVWTITSGFVSVSAHVHVAPGREQEVLADVCSLLADRFGIVHSTIQLEPAPAPQQIR